MTGVRNPASCAMSANRALNGSREGGGADCAFRSRDAAPCWLNARPAAAHSDNVTNERRVIVIPQEQFPHLFVRTSQELVSPTSAFVLSLRTSSGTHLVIDEIALMQNTRQRHKGHRAIL